MPAFPKPKFPFGYSATTEIKALRKYRDNQPGRKIPAKKKNRLLVATWNIANLGAQKRRKKDYQLLAEVIKWFDIVGIQEVNDNLVGLRAIAKELPKRYRLVFSDRSGNQERAAFIYDSSKVTTMEKCGEIDIPQAEAKSIKLKGITTKFKGFDRSPYLVSFQAGKFKFCAINVHLYYGKDNKAARQRRALEAFAVSRWADLRRRDVHRYVDDFLILGDFNLPKTVKGDVVYDALITKGLRLPSHSTQVASNIVNDKHYDQIFFFPGKTKKEYTGKTGVFDFDGAVFRKLWDAKTEKQFRAYVRYYLSDHRPLWAEFKT